jgi:hypothetical protein
MEQLAESCDMLSNLTDRARQVVTSAQRESRRYGHAFVGTEHILLALIAEPSGEIAGALKSFGVFPQRVRLEIESLVAAGPAAVATTDLPLTPRVKLAIELAADEARDANQKLVDIPHLMLGLWREPDGVAGKVLVSLGIDLTAAREEVLKIRRQQMRLVELVVRPVRASNVHKRTIREELLAHLTGIYDEELARLHNPTAAMASAAERFGEPAALARELDGSMPWAERVNYYVSRNVGWRPPESTLHYMLRFAAGMSLYCSAIFALVLALVFWKDGWPTTLILAKPLVLSLPFMFVLTLVLGLLYFRLRDAMCGSPWARRSGRAAVAIETLIALVTVGSAIAFNAVAGIDAAHATRALEISLLVSAAAAAAFPAVARGEGPGQISDAVWAGLELGSMEVAR